MIPTDEQVKLLPCPCCRDTDLLVELITSSSGKTSVNFISCDCGMSGIEKAWNTRPALGDSVPAWQPTKP